MSLRKLKWRGIGRLELLAWLNEFLETDYTKIEHLADGIAYCQIFDALYPGKVNLQQLNFHARTEMECERNLRVLRRTFHLCEIKKEIPIRKLVEGVFQEHFEFLHWVHDYVNKTCPDAVRSYHGFERRQEVLRQSSSQSKSNATNTNLIPKYSNSMKTPREAYIGVSASGAEEVEDESTAIVDQSTSAEIAEENDEAVAPGGDEELDGMDPALRIVRHSFRNTLGARLALTKLEECMDSIRVMPPTMNTKRESIRGPTSRPEAKKNDRRAKTRATIATTDPMEPDPMMYKCMSELLECLELELLGRVKDLQYLEKSIEDLMGAQPSQQPKEDTVRVTSRDFSAQECASIVG